MFVFGHAHEPPPSQRNVKNCPENARSELKMLGVHGWDADRCTDTRKCEKPGVLIEKIARQAK